MSLLSREWLYKAPANDEFTVMQFNCLADGLAQTGDFKYRSLEQLEWISRWRLIKEEIRQVNPDVLCMQEMNHAEDLAKFLPDHYMLFCPKLSSPAHKCGSSPDGCCILLRRSHYELIDIQIMYYKLDDQGMNSGAIIVAAKDKRNNQGIVFATTHLKAKSGAKNDQIRGQQIQQLLARIQGSQALLSGFLDNGKDAAVILTGDFNSPPSGNVYSSIYNQKNSAKFSSLYNNIILPDDVELMLSAEEYAQGEPEYTTFKVRNSEGEKKHTIDYIWLSQVEKKIILGALWALPTIDDAGLPCDQYPSDHLALAVKIGWKELI